VAKSNKIDNHQQRIDECFSEISDILLHLDLDSLSVEKYLASKPKRGHGAAAFYGLLLARKLLSMQEKNKDEKSMPPAPPPPGEHSLRESEAAAQ
jgi:hypothetical protein